MGLDIRLPIGLLFSVLGLLLAAYGLVSDKGIYQRSLGFNVNLAWGAVLLVFGTIMVIFGKRRKIGSLPSPHLSDSEHHPADGHR